MIQRNFLLVTLFATAMALVEAVVVIYLRELIAISRDAVALGPYLRIEVWREVATLMMLVLIGLAVGRNKIERLSFSLFAFGLWDIWYYIWLKLFVDWPDSLLSWDILFLIPFRWWGPVLSPLLIAGLICLAAFLAVLRQAQGRALALTRYRLGCLLAGAGLALYIFMADAIQAFAAGQDNWQNIRPTEFNWPLFVVALALMAIPALLATWPENSRTNIMFVPVEQDGD
jgi:hypothetical protein